MGYSYVYPPLKTSLTHGHHPSSSGSFNDFGGNGGGFVPSEGFGPPPSASFDLTGDGFEIPNDGFDISGNGFEIPDNVGLAGPVGRPPGGVAGSIGGDLGNVDFTKDVEEDFQVRLF